jgi:hypothetical protein
VLLLGEGGLQLGQGGLGIQLSVTVSPVACHLLHEYKQKQPSTDSLPCRACNTPLGLGCL